MKNEKSLIYRIKIFFYGLLMGIADAIPGVSGATIALILGIYEKLVNSIDFLFSNILKLKRLFQSNEFKFLINLYSGVFVMLFISLKLINKLLKSHEIELFSFFVGLILASIIILIKNNKNIIIKKIVYLILGFLTGFGISSLKLIIENHSLLMVFFSGVSAISAMILPGISGSYVLLMLNQYSYLITAVSNLNYIVIIVFILGSILGISIMSKILNQLLKTHYNSTLAFLIGLLIGGLKTPISKVYTEPIKSSIFIIIGVFVLVIIEKISNLNKKDKKTKR